MIVNLTPDILHYDTRIQIDTDTELCFDHQKCNVMSQVFKIRRDVMQFDCVNQSIMCALLNKLTVYHDYILQLCGGSLHHCDEVQITFCTRINGVPINVCIALRVCDEDEDEVHVMQSLIKCDDCGDHNNDNEPGDCGAIDADIVTVVVGDNESVSDKCECGDIDTVVSDDNDSESDKCEGGVIYTDTNIVTVAESDKCECDIIDTGIVTLVVSDDNESVSDKCECGVVDIDIVTATARPKLRKKMKASGLHETVTNLPLSQPSVPAESLVFDMVGNIPLYPEYINDAFRKHTVTALFETLTPVVNEVFYNGMSQFGICDQIIPYIESHFNITFPQYQLTPRVYNALPTNISFALSKYIHHHLASRSQDFAMGDEIKFIVTIKGLPQLLFIHATLRVSNIVQFMFVGHLYAGQAITTPSH